MILSTYNWHTPYMGQEHAITQEAQTSIDYHPEYGKWPPP